MGGENPSSNSVNIYVNTTGSDDGAGSKESPYNSLNKAISSVTETQDTVIYLSEGTFSGEKNTNLNIDSSGGSLTIIGQGSDKTFIDGKYTGIVFTSMSKNSLVTLKDIAFVNCNSSTAAQNQAPVITSNAILTIENCVFENNYGTDAYGAIYQRSNNLTVINSTFKDNSNLNRAGAIRAEGLDNVNLINNTFINCYGRSSNTQGSSVYLNSITKANIVGNKFANIISNGYDASIYLNSNNGYLINNTFINCTNQGTDYSIVYLTGKNYVSGNKFINASNNMGSIYSQGTMNLLFTLSNITTNNTNFSITARVSDIDGNNVSLYRYAYVYFYLNGTSLGHSRIINSVSTLNYAGLLDNGKYTLTADCSYGDENSKCIAGNLIVNIDRTPLNIWVSVNGNDTSGLGTETSPFKTIKKALEYGFNNKVEVIIHLKEGNYSGAGNVNLTFDTVGILTIIGENYNKAIIDGNYTSPIFLSMNRNSIVTLKNITFINCNSSTTSQASVIKSNALLTIENCVFENNYAVGRYGAIYQQYNNLTVINSTFKDNSNSNRAGAIYASDLSVNLINNTFINCYGRSSNTQGSAVCLLGVSKANIIGNKFINITSNGHDASIYLNSKDGYLINNTFINCTNQRTGYSIVYLEGNNYVSGNKFINASNNQGNIYNGGYMNLLITLLNTTTNSTNFNLTAHVTDIDGNNVSISSYNRYIYFYANGTLLGQTKGVTNSVTTLNYIGLLDNGKYTLTANCSHGTEYSKCIAGNLIVNVDRTPLNIWVSVNGNDTSGLGTETSPFKTIKKALEYGFNNGADVIIHLKEGNYSGAGNVNLTLDAIGTLTIIGENYNKTIIDGTSTSTFFSTTISNKILSLNFVNLTFNNFASDAFQKAGVMTSQAGKTIINDCIFTDCFSKQYVGALSVSNLIMDNCIFEKIISDLSAGEGAITTKNATITNSIFKDIIVGGGKRTQVEKGYSYLSGAIIVYTFNKDETAYLYSANNKFVNITSKYYGGAISFSVKASSFGLGYGVSINDTFINNTAQYGGAIFGNCNVSGAKFINNTATFSGGALYLINNCTLVNNEYINNTAKGVLNDICLSDYYITQMAGLTLTFTDITSNTYMNDIVATLSNKDNAIISGGIVNFYVDGVLIGNSALSNNKANLNYVFKNGQYTISGNYSNALNDLVINNGTAKINVIPLTITDLYVSDSLGNDNYNGSLLYPFKTIKKAVYYAYGYDNVTIHILDGIYSGNENTNIIINTGLLTITGRNAVIDGGNSNTFFTINNAKNLIIDNLTFINGLMSSNGNIYISKTSGVTLKNVIYMNNNAVASLTADVRNIYNNGYLTIIDSIFKNNGADNGYIPSGVIYNNGDVSLTINNSKFINNTGSFSACIYHIKTYFDNSLNNCYFDDNYGRYVNYGAFNITGCNFVNNHGICVQGSFNVINSNFTSNPVIDDHYGTGAALNGQGDVFNCNFINNSAYGDGGAIVISGGSIIKCSFINNTAGATGSGSGGAIFSNGNTVISNCYFEGNSVSIGDPSRNGGGAIMNRGSLTVMNCNFVNNTASTIGGAIRNGMGYSTDTITIMYSNFTGNHAGSWGGAVASYTDPSQYQQVAKTYMTGCIFTNNTAGSLGGAYYTARSLGNTIDDCVFNGNQAPSGGALMISSDLKITNCSFIKNNATEGGAIRSGYSYSISDSYFFENNAVDGGAIYHSIYSTLKMVNSVILNNTASGLGAAVFGGSSTILNDNWWGSNDNPNNVSNLVYGVQNITNWFVATVDNNISSVFVGTNNTISIVFKNSNGTDVTYIIPNRVLEIVSASASVNSSTVNFNNNTATFTAVTNSEGNIICTVDNQKFLIDIVKMESLINASVNGRVYGNNVSIGVAVTGVDKSLASGTVNIIVNGKSYTVNLINGTASLNLGILNVNTYSFTVNYSGNDMYKNSSATSSFTIVKADTNVVITVKDIQYGEIETITVKTNPLYNGTGNILFGWSTSYPVTFVNGVAVRNFTNLAVGSYIVTATTAGNDNFNSHDYDPSGSSFRVSVADTKISIKTEDIIFGDPAKVVITSTPLLNGTVILSVDNGNPINLKLINGRVEYVLNKLEPGKHSLSAVYNGDANHKPAFTSGTINVAYVGTVTNDTFFSFFDSNGNLKSAFVGSNLTFVGTFSGLDITSININRPIDLSGSNATLLDIMLNISADNVSVNNFTVDISDDSALTYGVLVNGDSVVLSGNVINVTGAFDCDAYGVLADSCNDLTLFNNTVIFVGKTNGTGINKALSFDNCTDLNIIDNIMNITIPSGAIYDASWNLDIKTGGVEVTSCDGAVISNNIIDLSYDGVFGSYDIIYAVMLSDSADVIVSDNIIDCIGNSYIYGLSLSNLDNFTVVDNVIDSFTSNHYANTVVIGGESSGIVMNNNLSAVASAVAYPVYSSVYGANLTVDYVNNTVYGLANSVYGFEVMGTEESIINNTISADGNFTIGIASACKDLVVSGNTIVTNGAGLGTPTTGDSISSENVGIKINSGKAVISDNSVKTTGNYTVKLNTEGNTVVDNELISPYYKGDVSVTPSSGNIIANNTPVMSASVLTGNDVIMFFKNGTRYEITLTDIKGNALFNQSVVININGVDYVRFTDKDGKASIGLNLNTGNYTVTVTYNGTEDYTKSSITNNVTILSTVESKNITKIYRNDTQYHAAFVDGTGKVLADKEVTFNINGVLYKRTTNASGVATLNINLNSGTYILTAINPVNNEMVASTITVLSSIQSNNITKYFQNDTQYSATFLNKDGSLLTNTEVTFNINGVFYKRNTNANGVATLNINLNSGTYILTAINPVNNEMVASTITVLSSIQSNNITKYFQNDTQYSATFLNKDGSLLTNTEVTFNINGVFYKRNTNASGVATLNINLNSGTYILTAINPVNGEMYSNTIKVLPTLTGENLVKTYGNPDQYKAKLVDGVGKPVNGVNITMNINGIFYNKLTDSNGVASLNINLMPGEYIITSSYGQAVVSNTIKVNR